MPSERKQKVSSEAGSESVPKKKTVRKTPASDADLPDLPSLARKSRGKKSTKAANNANPPPAEEDMQEELLEDTASETGSQKTLYPRKSPMKRAKGK